MGILSRKAFLSAFLATVVVAALPEVALGEPASAWKQRIVYQILTDRFASSSTAPCTDLQTYCGGTFNAAAGKLAYVAELGCDALWISPIVENTADGYHGYWAKNFDLVNPHFGTSADLQTFVSDAHSAGIFVMLDVVANHVGNVDLDFSTIVPFNRSEHYHTKCQITDWDNQQQVEVCRLANLPDLNQTQPFVRDTLLQWVADVRETYGFNGLRVDTVPEVNKDFWKSYQSAADCFAVGEVLNGKMDYVAGYQGSLESVLNYPLFFTLRSVFGDQKSMTSLSDWAQNAQSAFADWTVLGNFVDNHDQPRFLNGQPDIALYRAALANAMFLPGIPIVYYGTEQDLSGGNDPENREALWNTGYSTGGDSFQWMKKTIHTAKQNRGDMFKILSAADDVFVFLRDQAVVATTNVGSQGNEVATNVTVTPYFSSGDVLCNIYWEGDCVHVLDGQLGVVLLHGETKVFVRSSSL